MNTEALPLTHRLTILYLATPLAIWLLGWLEWWFGAPATLALAWALRDVLRGPWRVSISGRDLALALVALAWVLAVPAGGVFGGEYGDWIGNRAIFMDLGRGGWPTHVTDHLGDEPPLLRYYLGYFLVPGLVGKWFGPSALNWAVPLWTWLGVALLLRLFTRELRPAGVAVAAAVLLIVFSGMDAVVYGLRHALFGIGELSFERFVIRGWDWAYNPELPNSRLRLDWQSHAMTLAQSPQHFLTGGLGALLLFQLRAKARFLGASGVVLAACVFWSPLVAAGLLAMAIALAVGQGVRPLLKWQNLVAAPLVGGLIALYLTAGRTDFDSAWLPSFYESGYRLATDLASAYVGEFLLLAFLLWRLRPQIVRDPFFVASLAVLLLAPWWCFSITEGLNDLLLRVPLGPLLLLSHYAAQALADAWHRERWLGWSASTWALVGVLALGAVNAGALYRGVYLVEPRTVPYEASARSTLVDLKFDFGLSRTTRAPPPLLEALLRDNERKGGPLGEVVFRSAADTVFFWENHLLFVTKECPAEDETAPFLLRFHASGAQAQNGDTPQQPYEMQDFGPHDIHHDKGPGGCIFRRPLPSYPIARATIGRRAEGRTLWLAEIPFDGGRPALRERP